MTHCRAFSWSSSVMSLVRTLTNRPGSFGSYCSRSLDSGVFAFNQGSHAMVRLPGKLHHRPLELRALVVDREGITQ